MKKLFPILMASAMAVGVGLSLADREVLRTDADYVAAYTLDGTITGGNSNYANPSDITQDGINWQVTGNTNMNPWRIGGNSLSETVREIYSTDPIESTIAKVELTVGTASSVTVNELKLIVASDSDFSDVVQTVTKTFSANSVITFDSTSGWEDCYYKFSFKITISGTSNKFVQFIKADFMEESSATLQSIELQNDGTAKTVYYDGDNVSFTGIKAVGTMSDDTHPDLTSACTITADKQKLATGDTKITYSATHPSGLTIADLELTITTSALAITKIEKNGNYRTNFVENQKLSFGTGNIKVTYNSGATKNIPLTTEGVQIFVGDTEITGQDYYMKLSDNGKNLRVTYEGFNFTIPLTVESYTPHEVGYWSPITDVSELEDGMEVIIVASGHDYSMGKSEGGNNINAIETSKDGDNKISSNIPGVQVYVLEASTVVSNTFAFRANNAYLAATGGTGSNYLKTEEEITEKSSFAISITDNQMLIQASLSGTNPRNTMKYNSSDKIFSCYASNSTVAGSWACLYKFTAQGKTPDQIAVENFCKTALHLDETDTENYIDPNDNTSGTACKGPTGYYEVAKAAYNELTNDQKDIFATSSDTIVNWGRQRLAAWAIANGESFDVTNHIFVATQGIINPVNSSLVIILVTIGAVLAVSISLFAITRKKKIED